MEMLKRFESLFLLLMFIGALNWGIVGVFDTNVLAEIFGTGTFTDVVYAIIGVAAVLYMPRLMDELHLTDHGAHPRGV